MTCRYLDDVLLLDSLRFDATKSAQLEEHALSCPHCAPVLTRIRGARHALLSQRTAVPADARAVVWGKLEVRQANTFLGVRSMAALAAFATAAVAWLVFFRPQPEVKPPAPVVAVQPKKEEGVRFKHGRILAQPGAEWTISEDGPLLTLRLHKGAFRVELDPGAPQTEVATVDARVRAVSGAIFVSRREDGTEVQARRGDLSIWPKGRAHPVALSEGKSLLLIGPRDEEANASKVVEKRPPPKKKVIEEPVVRADPVAELKTARAVIHTDAPRAQKIAERVLEAPPTPELEAEALAVLADAERRRGHFHNAARSYEKLRDHPQGQGYAEEAMLQRALLLEQLSEHDAALAELKRLEASHAEGVSAPERAALAAKLYLAKNDPKKAARAILAVKLSGRSRVLENRRIEVARALEKIDPELAQLLLKGTTEAGNERPGTQEAIR